MLVGRVPKLCIPGRDAFLTSEEMQDAVIRNIEVIGEAAKRISAETRGVLNSLDWRAICGMRDVLIHDYISVDLDELQEFPREKSRGLIEAVSEPLRQDFRKDAERFFPSSRESS